MGNGYCEDNKLQCLLWIVSHAISVEYEDNCISLCVIIYLVEKYNSATVKTDVSDEDVELLQSFGKELLKIATFMNLSIVDEHDISSMIDVLSPIAPNSRLSRRRSSP